MSPDMSSPIEHRQCCCRRRRQTLHIFALASSILLLLVLGTGAGSDQLAPGEQKAPDQQQKQQQQQSIDDLLKDTIQLLDVFDKKLVQVNNRTSNALLKHNLRQVDSLQFDERTKDDAELTRLAEKFSSERHNVGDQMAASSSSLQETMSDALEPQNTLAQTLLGAGRRSRQLANSSQLELNDFTERHIQFSLDLMQALFGAQLNPKHDLQQRNSQLESFLISPVSIQQVLMMMHLGARGQTKRELANCLHLPAPYAIGTESSASPLSSLQSGAAEAAPIISSKLLRRNPQLQQTPPKRPTSATQNNVHELFGAALKNLLRDPAVVKALTSASQIFLQRDLSLAAQYEQAVRHYYGAELRPVDFQQHQASAVNSSASAGPNSNSNSQQQQQKNSEQSVQQLINDWVERQTKGKISQFLASPVPSSTLLMAINVLFFKGDWQYKFDPADTDADAWFTLANGKTVKLPMMVNKLPLAHAYDAAMKTSVIELPYKAQRLGLFVLLPDESDGIFHTMQHLNSTTFANMISMMRKSAPPQPALSSSSSPSSSSASSSNIGDSLLAAPNGINVRMPKFTIESSPRLSQILTQQMGLKTLFSADVADLSGMFNRTPARRAGNSTFSGNSATLQVGLDELVHRAVLQVHEQGSVAAAASATIVERVGVFNDQYFEADHPFIIFLMDKQTGLVLFSGIFAGPGPTSVESTHSIL